MEAQILELGNWETPATCYEVEKVRSHCISKHTYSPGFYAYHGIDGYLLFSIKYPLVMTTLKEFRQTSFGTSRWSEWMADSPTDYRAMQKYAAKAHGNVLTTGLGLGLVTHELCKNPLVESITVVEISQDVIDLVGKYLPEDHRINIVRSDFWEFIDKDSTTWDSIIVDLWVFWGMEQQLEIYRKEIMPAAKMLKAKYPGANIVFHGFAGMPTLEQLEAVIEAGDVTNPLVIDPLIYGLGDNHANLHISV